TNRTFHNKLVQAGMTQSMSRVAHCIDNGPMEGFWGILKRERYYGRRFTSKKELVQMIKHYIHYYNTRRVAQLGSADPQGKARIVSRCIKSDQQHKLLAGKTLYFFTVLLTGCGSEGVAYLIFCCNLKLS